LLNLYYTEIEEATNRYYEREVIQSNAFIAIFKLFLYKVPI